MTYTPKPKIKFEQQQILPIFSFALMLICAAVYVMSAQPSAQKWIVANCFVVNNMSKLLSDTMTLLKAGAINMAGTNLTTFVTACCMSTFASLDRVQVVGNCYFLYVFGSSVEQRIGPPRFMMLCLIATILPWPFVLFEAGKLGVNACYYGPFFLICAILGASFVFPPEKKINTEWFKSARGNIFETEPRASMTDKYQFKPAFFMCLFFIYEGVMWYLQNQANPALKILGVIPGVAAVFIGYVMVTMLVFSATGSLKDGPMRLMAVKMYNDILKLDVGHDMAIRGTSMSLGLPPERVREWVSAQKGKMRIS